MKNSKLKKKREVDYKYKILSIIFGVCTIVFGLASIGLGLYSIHLQQKESESRLILTHLKETLTALSDTTTDLRIKTTLNDIKNSIPENYKLYVRSVGSLADTLERYKKALMVYEKRIIQTLLPAEIFRKQYPLKGFWAKRAMYFDIIYPLDSIRPVNDSSTFIVIKLKIPVEEIYCMQIRLESDKYTLGTYNYHTQGIYTKLEIPDVDILNPKKAQIGIYLKMDTLTEYPPFYRKEIYFKQR